ncbi:M1 family metallopeptidase [Shewanella dokdonensis]|uniref:Aminopeptidase N n=2 Tax=Shewanella dokdonensis TaxID=712036 RepID=A0ABX8DL37_9GAMM|nr:M1 family metallopeptidase [Shewanella dokdonensis]MCL1074861.1 M1 family metallopeptidase [Shewanella dokdonensis]QVK24696.1 M1 family metallopeptidase [Shewanella dokdonensis]
MLALLLTPLAHAVTDSFSYANTQDVQTQHIDLQLTLDFKQQQIRGVTTLTLHWSNLDAPLILDSRDLTITKVEGLAPQGRWQPLAFTLAAKDPVLGQKLTIATGKLNPLQVRISHASATNASGLQWLTAAQTLGKKQPFLFSQNEAIHARSWLPLQDTPAIRASYSATVTAPEGLTVLMSADRHPVSDTVTRFEMPQAIPSYLIAIAAGHLTFAAFDARSGVWAEPEQLSQAQYEFADTPKMISTVEQRYGRYRWGRYDLLILPPSFPFGGMENPKLSFITPTVIAGDRSLVSVIAHELAHSWSGNLVTNASWQDLWLNEGFTSYVENRVVEDLYGRERAQMELAIAYGELQKELPTLPKALTALHADLNGSDPDTAFSGIPYTKGQLFLVFLEQKFGRKHFDTFVKQYFAHFAFGSIDTASFEQYLQQHLLALYPNVVSQQQIHTWLYEPGLPEFSPVPKSDAFKVVDAARAAWLDGTPLAQLATQQWNAQQWLHFLKQMPSPTSKQPLTNAQLQALDKQFNFSNTGNDEIAFAWFSLALDYDDFAVKPALGQYLQRIGRLRLVLPLYEKLAKSSEKAWAAEVFAQASKAYHPLTINSIAPLFQ